MEFLRSTGELRPPPRQRAAFLLFDALACPSNLGTSSFLTDPTIPEAFQFVDWH